MDLSIVILEYHSIPDLKVCLQSIIDNLNGLKCEILVSSNSCYDTPTQDTLIKAVPDITWIFNKQNFGFAGGINLGIRKCTAKHIMILNVDARIKSSLIIPLKYLIENKKAGLIGPRIMDQDSHLQDTCRTFMTPARLTVRMLRRLFSKRDVLLNENFDYNKIKTVDWVIGACMVTTNEAIKKVGLLDDKYFLYVEDMDWCKRFWNNNYEVIYLPTFTIEYKGDRKSISPILNRKLFNKYSYYHLKSYFRFLIKHYSPF